MLIVQKSIKTRSMTKLLLNITLVLKIMISIVSIVIRSIRHESSNYLVNNFISIIEHSKMWKYFSTFEIKSHIWKFLVLY